MLSERHGPPAGDALDVVTDDVERISGRRPVSLAEHLAATPPMSRG